MILGLPLENMIVHYVVLRNGFRQFECLSSDLCFLYLSC